MFVKAWKYLTVAVLVLGLGASPGWAKKKRSKRGKTDGCKEAEKIIKHTDDAKKKAKEYTDQVKVREESQKTLNAAIKKETKAKADKDTADEAFDTATKAKDKAEKELNAHLTAMKALANEGVQKEQEMKSTDPATASAATKRHGEITALLTQMQTKETELRGTKKTADEEFTKTKGEAETAAKNLTDAEKERGDAEKKTKEESGKEDQAAKARVKEASKLLQEHQQIGHSAVRCPKYQLTGAGASLWQKGSSTGKDTVTKALDKQMDLFANTGAQTEEERIKDAQDLALGGFENKSGSAEKFRKTIEKRIKETTTKRDEENAQFFKDVRGYSQERINRLNQELTELQTNFSNVYREWEACLHIQECDQNPLHIKKAEAEGLVIQKQQEIARAEDYLNNQLKKGKL